MRFFLIQEPRLKRIPAFLKESCEKLNVEYHEIDPNITNYLDIDIQEDDALLRISSKHNAQILEKYLLTKNPVTFYNDTMRNISKPDNVIEATIIHEKNNIPIAKTVFSTTPLEKEIVKKHVEFLGGFPLILKTTSGSKGIGVIKIDSFSSLISVLDYLKEKNVRYILREFIDVGIPAYTYRAIVIGNEVVFTYKNMSSNTEDFRSNTDQRQRDRKQIDLDPDTAAIMVNTVNSIGFELGAVDYLIDQEDNIKILEVNFPFNFIPVVKHLNFNVNDKMIEYLLNKSGKKV